MGQNLTQTHGIHSAGNHDAHVVIGPEPGLNAGEAKAIRDQGRGRIHPHAVFAHGGKCGAGMQEHDRIKGGNVDAFGQATGIGQDAAGVFARICLEPVQQSAAGLGVENAVALRKAIDCYDVTHLLGLVDVPTLVLHAREDSVQPAAQSGVLAANIPGAQLRVLESKNSIPLPQDPCWTELMDAIEQFLN